MDRSKVKITWAVDLLDSDDIPARRALMTSLKSLAHHTKVEIEPVYVLAPLDISLPFDYTTRRMWEFEKNVVQELCNDPSLPIPPTLLPGKILAQSEPSLREAARKIVEHTNLVHNDFIVTSTHARKGLARMAMGSFTENLIMEATTPVLAFNPQTHQISSNHGKILFPTDFNPDSAKLFSHVMDWARLLNSEVTLLHDMEHEYGFTSRAEKIRIQKLRDDFYKIAREHGVTIQTQTVAFPTSLSDAITEIAEESGYKLIIMASQSSDIRAAIMGSVSREVVRKSSVPVVSVRLRHENLPHPSLPESQ